MEPGVVGGKRRAGGIVITDFRPWSVYLFARVDLAGESTPDMDHRGRPVLAIVTRPPDASDKRNRVWRSFMESGGFNGGGRIQLLIIRIASQSTSAHSRSPTPRRLPDQRQRGLDSLLSLGIVVFIWEVIRLSRGRHYANWFCFPPLHDAFYGGARRPPGSGGLDACDSHILVGTLACICIAIRSDAFFDSLSSITYALDLTLLRQHISMRRVCFPLHVFSVS
ncbi:hypothetical protein B0H11DRAFT_2196345 [Mycena galericulata]|nr:hypothetical protein B0H11DRAFT_2196345 [Mycena galericulata]